MCALCGQAGKTPGGYGCLDVSAASYQDSSDSGGSGDVAAPVVIDPGPEGQNPGSGGDTVPGSTATTFTQSNDSYVRGYINSSGDQDWYRVNLVVGQQYTFALNGFGTGAIDDPYLRVFNSAGVQLTFDDDSGPLLGSRLTYTAPAPGIYYVSAGGFGAGDTGQYILTMNDGATPYFPVVTVGDITDYLTNTYWEVNGDAAGKWGVSSVTFNVQGLEPERAALARIAFQTWADVANLTFVETTGAAQITLDDTTADSAFSSSSTSGGTITSSSINVSTDWYGGIDAVDSYTLQTFIHEIGHSLGLGHSGPYNGSATYGIDNVYANDSWQMTLMSYMDQVDASTGSYRFTMTPQMADILAVQRLYGAPNTRTGDTVYGFGSTAGFGTLGVNLYNFAFYSQAPALTIFDSGGTDTLNASNYSQNQVIDLRGGYFSNIGGLVGNIGIYTTAVIENAIGGSGADTITGNAADNTLNGGAGADLLNGGGGGDALDGGADTDTADYSGAGSRVAVDLIYGASSFGWFGDVYGGSDAIGDSYVSIERVIGSSFADSLTGSDNADRLEGGNGDDVLSGRAGNDTLVGGAGDDLLIGGGGDDTFVFVSGDGHDIVSDFVAGNAGGDLISLGGYGVSSFADLGSHMSQVGNDVVIFFDAANQITLQNVLQSNLNAQDFLFS